MTQKTSLQILQKNLQEFSQTTPDIELLSPNQGSENMTPSPSDNSRSRKPRKRWNDLHQFAKYNDMKRAAWVKEQQQLQMEEEKKQCTFTPTILDTSRTIAAQMLSITSKGPFSNRKSQVKPSL